MEGVGLEQLLVGEEAEAELDGEPDVDADVQDPRRDGTERLQVRHAHFGGAVTGADRVLRAQHLRVMGKGLEKTGW